MVWALRPAPLSRAGLPEALGALASRLAEDAGLHAETVVTGTARPLPPEAETALLRAAQEALANVRKHAAASSVTVTISYFDDLTVLDIADDGAGFARVAAGNPDRGVGLTSMRERVTELGGAVEVETLPGEGTTVVVQIPDALAPESGAAS
jgi:signal transduction histidine kinase